MWTFVLNHSAETGLVLFFACFAAIAIFAATRTRQQLEGWSRLPLGPNDSNDAIERETK